MECLYLIRTLNTAHAKLDDPAEHMVFGEYNMFIFAKNIDNAAMAGLYLVNFYILDIRFMVRT